MNRNAPDKPATREDLREAIREAVQGVRGSSEFPTKSDSKNRVEGELGIARAEVREIIQDKTSQFVEKSDFAAVKSRVDFLTTGFWAIFALILTVILAAAVKYLFF